jgi:nucleoside-diphosphate-sugar epimerase
MRVLVAGDRGYIGAVLVLVLRAAGHEVDGLDLGLYGGYDLGPAMPEASTPPPADVRDVTPGQLAGYDAVLCLAALSNDPLGDLNPEATYSVDLGGTLHLARVWAGSASCYLPACSTRSTLMSRRSCRLSIASRE